MSDLGESQHASLEGPGRRTLASLLEIEHLSVEYVNRHGRTAAVRDVSFRVKHGEIVGIRARAAAVRAPSPSRLHAFFQRRPTSRGGHGFAARTCSRSVGKICAKFVELRLEWCFKTRSSALNPVLRVGDLLSSVARSHRPITRTAVGDLVEEATHAAGLETSVSDRYPSELSGGMCQRVVIAMALISGASLLVADEPTTALDVTVQARILQLIQSLREERQMGCVFISHDLAVLSEICDRVIIMHAGSIEKRVRRQRCLHAPVAPVHRRPIDMRDQWPQSTFSSRSKIHRTWPLLPQCGLVQRERWVFVLGSLRIRSR